MSDIKVIAPEHITGTEQARHDWAIVTGKELKLKPTVFLHVPTGEYYCGIVGGVAYPVAADGEVKPGIVIILGIQNDPAVKFKILDAYEDNNVFGLIEKIIEARDKYGFGEDSRLLPAFYGDQEKYQTLIITASDTLERKLGHDRGLYIKDMVDLRIPTAFPLYVRQIFRALEQRELDINGNFILTGHLQGFRRDDAEKGKVENFPAVGLLGGIVHSLRIEKPWLEQTDGLGSCFNVDI